MYNKDEWLWTEKYRPKNLDDCILNSITRAQLQAFVDDGNIPNLTFAGPYGSGKTTAALAMFTMLGADFLKINSSKENGIDTIRSKLQDFASTMSHDGRRKYILLDEADGLTDKAQEGLRGFIEEFSSNCSFILTCNELEKITGALQSRCRPDTVDFILTKEDFKQLGAEFYHSLENILKIEGVEYAPQAVAGVIKMYYPDWRAVLSTLQNYSIKHKKIDVGVLVKKASLAAQITVLLKKKDWTTLRNYIGENYFHLTSFTVFARDLYLYLEPLIDDASKAMIIMGIAEFDFKNAFVTDKEINLMAFLTNVMTDVKFK